MITGEVESIRSGKMFQIMSHIALFTLCVLSVCTLQSSGLAIDQKVTVSNQELLPSGAKSVEAQYSNVASVGSISSPKSKSAHISDTSAPLEVAALRGHADLRRPIWALAHMVNSIKELDYRLA